MTKNIILHELKNIFLSPKFPITFFIISALLILSVYLGIQQYNYALRQYETVNRLSNQEIREKSDWSSLSSKIHRKPDPMQIFVSGVSYDIGRYSNVNSFKNIKLIHSNYSDNPVFAVFRFVDFSFIVTIVLALFTILFTYDAINGESERGTLKLIFSNSVPRKKYMLAKFTGIWLGLIIPLLIPLMISVLILLLYKIPFTGNDWMRLFFLFFSSLLLYSFFIALGVFISTLTRRTSFSFLMALSAWILFAFIIPRGGILAASQIIKVPGFSEIEGKQSSFEKQRWEKNMRDSQERWKQRNFDMEGLSKEERERVRDQKNWEWMEEEGAQRKQVQIDIDNNNKTLFEDYRNRKVEQEKLGFILSRFSPISAYQLAVMNISSTDIALKNRYEDALNRYRTDFISYKEKKQKENGGVGGIRVMFDSDTGFKIETSRDKGTLDLSDMPRFPESQVEVGKIISASAFDSSIILILFLVTFTGSLISFNRYKIS